MTSPTASNSPSASGATKAPSKGSGAGTSGAGQERGTTSIADIVVAKIAGIATREVSGVYDLGGGAARVVGRIRETLPGSPDLTQGVDVEVGEKQAAVDVAIVAEYGVAIHDLASDIRRHVIAAVEKMTGLDVTEVNVTVHDVHFADESRGDETESAPTTPRVQ